MVDELICIQKTFYKDYFNSAGQNAVFLLNEESAKDAWEKEIDAASSSYFDLPDSSWIIKAKSNSIGRWIESYNNDDNAAVEAILRKTVEWNDNTVIRFFAKKGVVFQTTWGNFLKYWDDFIAIEDDCPIVVPENFSSKEALLFRPIGDIQKIGLT